MTIEILVLGLWWARSQTQVMSSHPPYLPSATSSLKLITSTKILVAVCIIYEGLYGLDINIEELFIYLAPV